MPRIDDITLMNRILEARDLGFDMICPECGEGLWQPQGQDDFHDPFCTRNPKHPEYELESARRSLVMCEFQLSHSPDDEFWQENVDSARRRLQTLEDD
jgi:hypothetical protein